jgi:hypothetical protein
MKTQGFVHVPGAKVYPTHIVKVLTYFLSLYILHVLTFLC